MRSFSAKSDAELGDHVHVSPHLIESIPPNLNQFSILTANVGLHELLARAISVAISTGEALATSHIDSNEPDHELHRVTFFGSPAHLSGLTLDGPAKPVLVAILVVRPGRHDLMLAGEFVSAPNTSGPETSERAAILGVMENLIRDFADQWTPPRTLWDVPAEIAMPEILRNVARSVGR